MTLPESVKLYDTSQNVVKCFQRLRHFEKKFKKIFGLNKVTGGWKQFFCNKLQNLYPSSNIIKVIIQKMSETRSMNSYTTAGKSKVEGPFARYRSCEGNISSDLK